MDVLDEKDHQVHRRLVQQELVPAELRIRHDSKSETLLSLCDLIAGAAPRSMQSDRPSDSERHP